MDLLADMLVDVLADVMADMLDAFNKFGLLRQYMCEFCNRMSDGNIMRRCVGGHINGVLVRIV